MRKLITTLLIVVVLWSCKNEIIHNSPEYYKNANLYESYSSYSDDYSKHPAHDTYQKVLTDAAASGVPGIAVLIEDKHGIWAGSAGYADLSSRALMEKNTISRAGSISKTFCAAILLLLQEQGKINLDSTLNEILSADTLKDIANTHATVRQVLSHTAGIPNYTSDLNFFVNSARLNPYPCLQPEEILNKIRNKPADFEIGKGWNYSNTGYVLAEMVIEAVTGKESHIVLQELILDPLDLVSTYYDPGNPFPKGLARGYSDYFGNGIVKDITEWDVSLYTMDGGIISTVYDLHTYIKALLYDRAFFPVESLEQMKAFYPDCFGTDKIDYGLGFMKITTEHNVWYGHGGNNLGYAASMYSDPSTGYAITILVNCTSSLSVFQGEIDKALDSFINN